MAEKARSITGDSWITIAQFAAGSGPYAYEMRVASSSANGVEILFGVEPNGQDAPSAGDEGVLIEPGGSTWRGGSISSGTQRPITAVYVRSAGATISHGVQAW
ncbi:MAG: hypothetical protein AAF747_08550 [Planctomycetota bacterium]